MPLDSALGAVVRRDEAYYIRTITSRIGLARLPYRRLITSPDFKPMTEDDMPGYAIISRSMLRSLDRLAVRRDKGVAVVGECRLALALCAYREESGSYPATLAQISRNLGRKLPADPFSGRDFVYKRQGKGFLLYSIGPNLKDDGGIEAKPAKAAEFSARQDDIVWRMDR